MEIVTLITKRSVREVIEEKKFLKFYTSADFSVGAMVEIIEGNRKALAVIIKKEPVKNLKLALRSHQLEIKQLKLSKTGPNANGKILKNFTLAEIKAKKIPNFFPKKRIKKTTEKKEKYDLESLSLEQYKNRDRKYYNETQELVDTIRKHFNEKAVRGTGSFSYYIGFFKKAPLPDIKRFFAEAKQSRQPVYIQKRIFWKKFGEYLKNLKN